MRICLRRREFIAGFGGAAALWPLAARAQQRERVRRIGVLLPLDKRVSAFTQALADLGWTERRNLRMDLRWAGGDMNRISIETLSLVVYANGLLLARPRSVGKCGPTMQQCRTSSICSSPLETAASSVGLV
jgi:putative ABC transport system substrate-binding protein